MSSDFDGLAVKARTRILELYADGAHSDENNAIEYFKALAHRSNALAIAIYTDIALTAEPNTHQPAPNSHIQIAEAHPVAQFLLAVRGVFQHALQAEFISESQGRSALAHVSHFLAAAGPATVNLATKGQPREMLDTRGARGPNGEFHKDKFVFNDWTWHWIARFMEKQGALDPVHTLPALAGLAVHGDVHLNVTDYKSSAIARAVAKKSDPAALAAAKAHLLDLIIDTLKADAISGTDPAQDRQLAAKITIFDSANPFIREWDREEGYKAPHLPPMVNALEIKDTAAEKVRALINQYPVLEKNPEVRRLRAGIERERGDLARNAQRMDELQRPEPQVAIAVPPVAQPDLSQTQPPPVRRGIFGLRK
jgi:hypothetical protein